MNYRQSLDYLNTFQFHGYKLGLERMEAALSYFGNPHKELRFIHVAGTNGKGSVCATLSAILNQQGYKVGLYTSPHLVRLNERFRFCENEISDDDVASLLSRIREIIEKGYDLSYFEITTLMAILWFYDKACDFCVLETGLGGRLDATNIISSLATGITSISIDHKKYLGSDIKSIAFEKAGIIKPAVPVISGVMSSDARDIIHNRAIELDADIKQLGRDFDIVFENGFYIYTGWGLTIKDIEYKLKGIHQGQNLAIALAIIEKLKENHINIPEDAIKSGCENVNWQCRCEVLQGRFTVILDGAHNMDGAKALKEFLLSKQQDFADNQKFLLWGCSDDGFDEKDKGKDIELMLMEILPFFDRIFITEPPDTRYPVSIERWKAALHGFDIDYEYNYENIIRKIIKTIPQNGLLCVSGSLYLVGKTRAFLIKHI
jgi:dihydrofolate synthase/folylpolyglutamate synthase